MSEFQPLARHDADSAGDGSAPPVVAPYKATRLAVRVAIPQLALLLCLSLLGHVCYEASIPEVEHKSKIHLTVGPGRYDLAARQILGVYTSGLHKGGPLEQRPNTARLRTASKAAPGIAGDITDPGFPPIQLKAMEPETRQG